MRPAGLLRLAVASLIVCCVRRIGSGCPHRPREQRGEGVARPRRGRARESGSIPRRDAPRVPPRQTRRNHVARPGPDAGARLWRRAAPDLRSAGRRARRVWHVRPGRALPPTASCAASSRTSSPPARALRPAQIGPEAALRVVLQRRYPGVSPDLPEESSVGNVVTFQKRPPFSRGADGDARGAAAARQRPRRRLSGGDLGPRQRAAAHGRLRARRDRRRATAHQHRRLPDFPESPWRDASSPREQSGQSAGVPGWLGHERARPLATTSTPTSTATTTTCPTSTAGRSSAAVRCSTSPGTAASIPPSASTRRRQ